MNIQAISGMNFTGARTQTASRIQRVTPLDEYTESLLKGCSEVIEQTAANYGKNVRLGLNKDTLLINSGNLTSTFNTKPNVDTNALDVQNRIRTLKDTIVANIKGNIIAEECTLAKGVEHLELNTPKEAMMLDIMA